MKANNVLYVLEVNIFLENKNREKKIEKIKGKLKTGRKEELVALK